MKVFVSSTTAAIFVMPAITTAQIASVPHRLRATRITKGDLNEWGRIPTVEKRRQDLENGRHLDNLSSISMSMSMPSSVISMSLPSSHPDFDIPYDSSVDDTLGSMDAEENGPPVVDPEGDSMTSSTAIPEVTESGSSEKQPDTSTEATVPPDSGSGPASSPRAPNDEVETESSGSAIASLATALMLLGALINIVQIF